MNSAIESTKVIMLEFNELCPSLLAKFMDGGKLPNFSELYRRSLVFTTDAGEAPPHLDPWIQWITVHHGMMFDQHGAFHLGDGRHISQQGIASLLSEHGVPVGIFGSMNTNYRGLRGFYVPDPWEADAEPEPSWLAPYYETVSRQVQNSSGSQGLGLRDMSKFGRFLVGHGVSAKTLAAVAKQLVDERRDAGVKWRRASLLEKIQYDLFRYLDRKFTPQFATFFCNSTAHYQHYFWRNMHPEIFELPPDADDHPSLQQAIVFGYQEMDKLVGRFLRDFPQATLILCTALSQQPWVETTKCTYRPRDFREFLAFANVDSGSSEVDPVMAEEFRIRFASLEEANEAATKLRELTYHDQPLMTVECEGSQVFTGCRVNDASESTSDVSNGSGTTVPFRQLFHVVHSVRSGKHHPDGALWIGTGAHRVMEQQVPLAAIAPTILGWFGLTPPSYMHAAPLETGIADGAYCTVNRQPMAMSSAN